MSQNARDLTALIREGGCPLMLRRLALNIIAPGCTDDRGGL